MAGGTRGEGRYSCTLCVLARVGGGWILACRRGWRSSRVDRSIDSPGFFFFLTYVRSREHVVKWCRSMRGIDCFFRGAKRKRREREGSFYAWKEAGLIRFRRWKYLSKGSFFSLFFFFWGWMGGCFCERKLGFNGMWKFFWKININERCFFFWLNSIYWRWFWKVFVEKIYINIRNLKIFIIWLKF